MEPEPTGARPNGPFIWCSGALDHDHDFQKLRTSNPSKDLPENTNSSLVFKAPRLHRYIRKNILTTTTFYCSAIYVRQLRI